MTTTANSAEILALEAHDETSIDVRLWKPGNSEPRAVIQVLHGLGEHADRYGRFAEAATLRDLAVVAHNHRGHGPNAAPRGSFGYTDGWALLEADALVVREEIDRLYPETPVILLGHSMGSFLAQYYAMHYGGRMHGLLLSGSGWPSRTALLGGYLVASLTALAIGREKPSKFLDRLGFDSLNRRFEPARTEFDWLSRDENEVDRYKSDPLCGGPYTSGLWVDFLRGMLSIASDSAIQRIPGDLPILITGGGDDPVGGDNGMGKLMLHYAQTLHSRLTLKIYPAGRHEMLNETIRDEVTSDWLDWIDRVIGAEP